MQESANGVFMKYSEEASFLLTNIKKNELKNRIN